MWFQFAMHAGSGAKLFRCQRCNEPFAVGHTDGPAQHGRLSNAFKVVAFKRTISDATAAD